MSDRKDDTRPFVGEGKGHCTSLTTPKGRQQCVILLPSVWIVMVTIVWVYYLHVRIFELSRRHNAMETRLASFERIHKVDVGCDERRRKRSATHGPTIGDSGDPDITEGIHGKHTPSGKKTSKKKQRITPCEKARQRKGIRPCELLMRRMNALTKSTQSLNKALKSVERPSVQMCLLNKDTSKGLKWTVTGMRNHAHSTDKYGNITGVHHFFRLDSDYQWLLINQTGRYQVYAQVTYNGRSNLRFEDTISDPVCSYQVLLNNTSTTPIGILYGAVTQYNLGRWIQARTTGKTYAHDSVHVSGVFTLETGDRLQLLNSPSSSCDVRTEPQKTFFGVYLLA